jgi:hypothetical protein
VSFIGVFEEFIIRGLKPASSALPLTLLDDWWPSSTSTSSGRPLFEPLAGTSHLPAAKWFIPGSGLQVAGFRDSLSVEKTKDYITFFYLFLESYV